MFCTHSGKYRGNMVNKRKLFATVKANDKIRIYKSSFEVWYKSQNRYTIVAS